MKGILYLWKTGMKNRLKDLKNHPSRLILYLFIFAMLGMTIGVSFLSPDATDSMKQRDVVELYAILSVLFLFLLNTEISKGLSSGASFFGVADVNLLFQSPTSPKTILYYGLVRQMGTSLLIGCFILFQASTLRQFYNVGIGGLFAIFFGYCFLMFIGEILAVWIYSFISNNEKRKNMVKAVQYGMGGVILLAIILEFLKLGEILPAGVAALNGPLMQFIPVAGWVKVMISGLLSGNILQFSLFLVLNLILTGGIIWLVSRSDADYYEDVLQATERNYAVKEAAKDGKIMDAKPVEKINMKKTGINRGKGASVLFYKHLLENRRANSFILDTATIIMAVVGMVFSLLMGEEKLQLIMLFGMMTYMQLIMSAMGRWVKELAYPFIYLIPQNPVKKLLWAILESLQGSLLSGILVFVPCGIILKADLWEIAACIVARVSFACIFASGNVLIERVFGNVRNKGLIMMLYFLMLIALIAPGIVGMIILMNILSANALGILVSAAWNVLVAFLIILACRDILHNMEMNMN